MQSLRMRALRPFSGPAGAPFSDVRRMCCCYNEHANPGGVRPQDSDSIVRRNEQGAGFMAAGSMPSDYTPRRRLH